MIFAHVVARKVCGCGVGNRFRVYTHYLHSSVEEQTWRRRDLPSAGDLPLEISPSLPPPPSLRSLTIKSLFCDLEREP